VMAIIEDMIRKMFAEVVEVALPNPIPRMSWHDAMDRYGSDRTEWEANWFAAALLMPEEQFRSDISTANGNIATVAKNYGVSLIAAKIRAEALGIAT